MRTLGREVRIDIETSLRVWQADTDGQAWLHIEEDMFGITISAEPNGGAAERTSVIGISAGAEDNIVRREITVTQRAVGDPDISLDIHDVVFTPNDQEPKIITVTTNQDEWTWSVNASSHWLLVEQKDNTLVLSPIENMTTVNEAITIEVNAGYGNKMISDRAIAVNQAEATISFSPDAVIVMTEGESKTVRVEANQVWRIGDITESWVKAEITGDDTFKLIIDESNAYDERRARIPIVCGIESNEATGYVTVVQWGNTEKLMIFEYEVANGNTIILPISGTGLDCSINWGDGTTQFVTSSQPSHKYNNAGIYRVSISGNIPEMSSSGISASAKAYLKKVIQWGLTGLKSMSYALYASAQVTDIPGDAIGSFRDVTTFASAFNGLSALQSIPADLFRFANKATDFESVLQGKSSSPYSAVTVIPAGLFDNCTSAEKFASVFRYQKNITGLPAGLFDKTVKAANFDYAFSNSGITTLDADLFKNCNDLMSVADLVSSTPLTAIPATLFSGKTKIETLRTTFSGTSITQIPPELFDGLTNVWNTSAIFQNCALLENIPAGLFDDLTEVTLAQNMFSGCKALQAIPAGLFDAFTKVTSFSSTFKDCVGITEIPDGLFAKATKTDTFRNVFTGCTSLTTIGNDVFNFPSLVGNRDLLELFKDCTALETIPEGLFVSLVQATGFNGIFRNCTSLNSIPEGLFAASPNATDFTDAFNGCTALTSIPTGLFDNNTKVTNFGNVFNGCTALTGESPYTVKNGVNVHIYERTAANGFTVPTSFVGGYKSCTGLSDYADIPTGWK
jgi:hypothetical protein